MKAKLILLLVTVSSVVFSQTQKINLKGFGEVSVVKENDYYVTNLGKLGSYNFSGSIDPLQLTAAVTVDQLSAFPGFNVYENLGVQEASIQISSEGLSIEASIDTRKNLGKVFQMYKINSPTIDVSVQLSKTGFEMEGELSFEDDPIVIDVIPDFSRYTLEKLSLNAGWEPEDGELAPSVGFAIQMRWKPTSWDPDIQSVTEFSYNLLSQEISASISMTDTWINPMLLSQFLKGEAVKFSNVAASVDWPIGSPAPTGFGFNIGEAKFFDLDFSAQLAITPADKKVALYAYRNTLSFNDFSRILHNGFGLNVPDVFPNDIYIKDAEILFSPNGGEVGEFDIPKGFILRGKAKLLDALDAEVDFTASFDDGFHLYYNMDAAFKSYLEKEFQNHPSLKYISGQLLRTLEVRKIELKLDADKQLHMSGATFCELTVLDKDINFNIEGAFSPDALKDKILQEVLKVAGPEATAVINAVGKGVQEASKVAGQAISLSSNLVSKYAQLAVVKKDHVHHIVPQKSDNYCYDHCVPNRANDMTKDILPHSMRIVQDFHDRIIDDIVDIEGDNDAMTRKLRQDKFLREWNEMSGNLEKEWERVKWDKGYVGFFLMPENATNGGHKYRKLVDEKKQQYIRLKDQLLNNLLSIRLSSNYLFSRIKFANENSYLHVEKGPVSCTEIAPGWHSAMWYIEPVPGTEFVRIKNRWKGTYLNIEHGKVESSKIEMGWHSAMWAVERASGSDEVLIRNRWKGTYLNMQKGQLVCSKARKKYAEWKIEDATVGAKAWNTNGEQNWSPGNVILVSNNRKYKLVFQGDGNLTLIKYDKIVVWASGTNGKGASNLRFQHDGNLCIRSTPTNIVWASNSYNKKGEALYLQDDGNLVVHAPGAKMIWSPYLWVDYDRNAGCGTIYRGGQMLKKHCGWSGSWHSIVPMGCNIMFYDKGSGHAETYRIDNAGNMQNIQTFNGFSTNWSKISWLSDGNCKGIIKFEQADGFWEKYNCNENGNINLHSRKQ